MNQGVRAAVSVAASAPVVRVFAAIAGSVAGASAPPAVSLLHQPSAVPGAGDPGPAFAEASVAVGPPSLVASPAVAGICDRVAGSQYSELQDVQQPEGRWDVRRCSAEGRCSPGAKPACWFRAELQCD